MLTASQVTLDMLWVKTPDEGLAQIGIEPFGHYQDKYEARAGRKNIVWKCRQMGFTTYSLAKAFVAACNGKTAISVVNGPSAAEYAFEVIKTFIKHLPDPLPIERLSDRDFGLGLRNSANRYQLQIFSSFQHGIGRGTRIDFAHFSEFAWWSPGNQLRNLLALMPALSSDSELIIESTPDPHRPNMFNDIWYNPEETGFVKHSFSWWINPSRVSSPVPLESLTDQEEILVKYYGLTLEQIGWRRKKMSYFENLYGSVKMFKSEYGEPEV